MNTPGNIFLIGPMGAGKTTIGRQLARALHRRFVDSDRVIEERTGVDIPLIFELEGEAGFRRRERKVIDELTQQPDIVLATGGGAILDPDNRRHLMTRGTVVYLHTTIDQQLSRTGRDQKRPLLQTDDPRARLSELMAVREPLYREIADLVIETDGRCIKDVVREISRRLRDGPQPASAP
ncbi:shikimate kinase AroK [Thiohalobacter sp. IOR34]|uniref:shikimate kinase AroK n=1 Tax=Thiohalobacter sp. IOR34 TaxID=3057176 RepID=UPI0025B086BA|nr:shikimate kinase AroK [Thiohalobacter sp. IOR34]WJW75684.1 shikimate kinase AroK [Thiohalobacter sp. IOR34]